MDDLFPPLFFFVLNYTHKHALKHMNVKVEANFLVIYLTHSDFAWPSE